MLRSTQRQIKRPTTQTNERDQVPRDLVVELQRQQLAALGAVRRVAERAAGVVARRGDDLQHDARQRQRHQHEIMPGDAKAETGIGDHQRQCARRHHADGNADPWRYAEMIPQQRRDIGADAHEAAMAERHQAEAAHDRPRGVGERPDQDQHQDVQVIGIAIDEGQRDQRGKANGPGGVTGIHERLANRPAGRMNIMTMKKANAST